MIGRMAGLGAQYCPLFHDARDDYIKKRNPNVSVVRLEQSEMWVDFARLVFAPNVLSPSAGSSWLLWSTLANDGNVKIVPFQRNMDVSVYPKNFEILNATFLYKPKKDPQSKTLLGFNNSTFADTPQGEEAVLKCYRSC